MADRPSFDDIADDMAFLDEWEDRYRYVIDLGRAMAPMDEALKTAATRVDGCASQVWIAPRREGEVIDFEGDSDAMIVRGLIAVLRALYGGRTADEILAVDAQAAFARLGLDQALSAQRSNGLRAMVARLRETAARLAA
ncbi:MAG: SufE family protein [Rhodobacteraceae bacterium]|nr:MAG: SufE family protein [Paracoccaceae bacterium]